MLLLAFGLQAQLARIQVIHNSPDPTVDVYAGPTLLLDNFAFRTASSFVDVPAGVPIPIGVAPATSTSVADVIFTQTVTFESGKTYVVTASGVVFNATTPFGLVANPNGRESAVNPVKVDLAIQHGSPDAPAVDIAVRTGGNLVTNLSYGNYSSYLSVDPGVYYLDVKAAGTNTIVQTYKADLSGLAGQALYVFASGFLTPNAGAPFGIFVAFGDGTVVELPATPIARVQVLHNSPEPTVDVWANADLLLDNFEFRTATPFINVPAGVNINLAIAPDNSTSPADALATFPVNLENGKTYVVTAQGIVGNIATPFTLNANDSAHEKAVNPAKVEFAVLHGSPDAPAVDVALFNSAQNLVANLAYNNYTGYLSVDPAVYYLDVKVAGTSTVVGTYKADLSGLAGGAAYVFASGLVTPGSVSVFGLFAALADGTVIELPLETPPQFARLQVIHNSPNPTVDVYVNNDLLLDDFTYRKATPFITVPAGVLLNVGIAPANSQSVGDVIANFPVTLAADGTYIVVASGILGNATTPFTLNVNPAGQEAAGNPAKVDIAVLHGAPNAPNVDVDEILTGNVISDLAYGAFTPYLSLDPAVYDFAIRAAGSPTVVASYRADLSSLAGGAAYVFASGLLGSGTTPFGLLAALPDGTVIEFPGTPFARAQVIHNSPAPTVDVYTGSVRLIDNFDFRTATPFVNVPANRAFVLGVAPASSSTAADAIFTQSVNFESGKTYVVAASGVVADPATPFGLIVNPNGRETSANPAKVELTILHGSPDAPAVDIVVRNGGFLATNLAYGSYTSYLSVDPAVYYLDVKPAGTNAIVQTYKADLSGLQGQAVYVFASGFLTPGASVSFGVFATLANGTVVELPATPIARVQVIHNSPEPTVDVWANADLLLDNFEFRTATPFIDVPAGVNIDLAVAPANSTSPADALAVFPVNLENGKTYIVTAQGIVGNVATPFTLNVNDGGRESAVNSAKVEFAVLHGAPDAPAVDVSLYNSAQNLVSNLPYNNFTGYLSVDPAVYYLSVKVAGTSTVVGTYKADLSGLAGGAAYVFASGLVTPGSVSAFGLYAALSNGTVVELPLQTPQFARLQVIHNSPNPTVDVYVNNDLLLNDFNYRDATPFITVPAGVELNVGIAPATSLSVSDVIANFPVTFALDQTYIVVASGILGNATTPFTLNVNPTGQEAASNPAKVDIAVLHGSPNAPNVDVDEVFTGNVISDLAYGAYTPYLSLDPAVYDFAVRPAGNPTVVASYRADLSPLAGGAAYVFASGLLGSTTTPFGLLAALPDGTVIELPTTPYARVQVIHNSPSPTVDVYTGNIRLLNDFAFRTATPFVDVPAGRNFNIGVAPGTSNSVADVIANFPAQLTEGKAYTIFAGGIVGNATTPFNLYIYDDALETAPAGSVALSVFHGAPDAPAVDVAERLAGLLVPGIAFGSNTGYLTLDPAEYVLDIKPTGTNTIVASYFADLTALGGVPLRVFASGLLGGAPAFGLFAALPNGTVVEIPAVELARLQVIHNSPEPTVDVYVNDSLLIDDFEYRTATPFFYAPAGPEIVIGVAPANSQSSNDAIATFPVTLTNGKTYVAAASGVVGSATTPFTLLINDAGREQAEDPAALELAILHGAPGAPAVDLVPYGSPVPLLEDLAYGDFTDYVSLSPDVVILDVTPANQPAQVVGTYGGDFSGLGGFAGVVFASGGPVGLDDFGLYLATPGGSVIPLPAFSRVQVIHNSPSPTVDVYIDQDKALEDFEFRQATNFGLLPSNTPISLAVAPANSQSVNDAIYTLPVAGLETGKTYTIVAAGVVGSATTPFQLYVNDAARFRSFDGTNVDVNLFHGAPDAPEVDITVPGGIPVFDNVSFGEFTPYISVPPAQYVLNVTPANDNNTIVQSYFADIAGLGGDAITVFASGYLNPTGNQPSFGAWVALEDGTTFPLPVFVNTSSLSDQLDNFSVSPNPAVNDLNVRFNATNSTALRYRIQDMTGRLMMEGDWGTVSGDFNTTLQVGQFSAGMYLLEVVSENGRMTTKFVK